MTPAQEASYEPPRDQWGRPKIIPPDGGKPVAYTRVSTMAKTLEDTYTLNQWKCRQVIAGLTKRKDLMQLASALGLDPEANKDKLNKVVEDAVNAAASEAAANYGTAIHMWLEAVDLYDAPVANAPIEMQADLNAYVTEMKVKGIEVLSAEEFVVCDELEAAGTFDRMLRLRDGRVVLGDVKTGTWAATYGAASVAVQVATYANSKRYTGSAERTPIHPDLDPTVGILMHVPAGAGQAEFYEIDLVRGWEAALTAKWVHGTWRKARPVKIL
jgi:hypothetical protein